MKKTFLAPLAVAVATFASTEELRSQELKRFVMGSLSANEMVPVERAFDVYTTYDPSATLGDFTRDNSHLGAEDLNSAMNANTAFYVRSRTCEIGRNGSSKQPVEMSYTVISKEGNTATEVSGKTLLIIYRQYSRRPNASFAEFQSCNSELNVSSPSDVVSFAEKNLILWSVAR